MTLPFEVLHNKNAFVDTLYGPAMLITKQEDADEYMEGLILYCILNFKKTRREARQLVKRNLGYYCGYYSRDVQLRVFRLFKTKHPIFGLKEVTSEEAFELGKKLVIKKRNKNI